MPHLDPERLVSLRWLCCWNPLTDIGIAPPGLRLVSFYDLHVAPPRELVRIEHAGTGPVPKGANGSDRGFNSSAGMTIDSNSGKSFMEAFLEVITEAKVAGREQPFGHQMRGNGIFGAARLFNSEIELVWRV